MSSIPARKLPSPKRPWSTATSKHLPSAAKSRFRRAVTPRPGHSLRKRASAECKTRRRHHRAPWRTKMRETRCSNPEAEEEDSRGEVTTAHPATGAAPPAPPSLRRRSQRLELLVGELDHRRSDVLLEVRDRRRSWDRQHHPRAAEQPRKRQLSGRCAQVTRERVQRAARLGELAGRDREPRDECEAFLPPVGEHGLRRASRE